MMKKMNNKKGFTIVEVTLALVFVSIILITIAWLTIHITSVYEKGLAMKAVNSTAKELIDDISRTIASSPARTVQSICSSKYDDNPAHPSQAYTDCVKDSARKFAYQQRYGNIEIKGEVKQLPTNGVFCTGRYSYIWNTAYVLNTEDYHPVLNYKATFNRAKSEDFRLLKVSDYNKELCAQHMDPNHYVYNDNNTYTLSSNPEVNIDLLDNSENNLAIYEFTMFSPAVHKITSSAFYSGTFILATLRGSIDINSTGEYCSDPPDNLDTDFAYCAINKFNFASQATGESDD